MALTLLRSGVGMHLSYLFLFYYTCLYVEYDVNGGEITKG